MALQVNIFLLLFGCLQAIFLSVVLLKKKVHRSGYFFLVAYLVIMILQITLKVMSKIWLMDNLKPLYFLSYLFPLLYGPLIYLFTRQFLLQKVFKKIYMLHFLPLLIIVPFFIFDNPYSEPPFIVVPFFQPVQRMVIELISLFVYHALAWKCWLNYNREAKDFSSDIKKLQINWMKQFIVLSLLVCSVITVVIFLMHEWFPYNQDIRFGFVALTLFIYWMSYCAWDQPQIFTVIHGFAHGGGTEKIPRLVAYKPAKKYSNSGLSEEEIKLIIIRLDDVMEKQKSYLDPEITMDKLADIINCSRHHLSQVLNACLQKSFYDYINTCRVEEAKLLLADIARANYKISSIAYDAGFNSLSAFNEVFKKLTGVTPSQYRKQPVEQSHKQRV
jgi:AraC-like DNA-binding protein